MTLRLERILTHLATKHATHLLSHPQLSTDRVRILANGLAKRGVLVIMGDVPGQSQVKRETTINDWVSVYGSLYTLLVETLFPSYTQISAVFADSQTPPVVVFEAQAEPIIQTMAGIIAPYVAVRQDEQHISEAELRGVMDMVLDELEAQNLPFVDKNNLMLGGSRSLRMLLQLPLTHIALTDFTRPIFQPLEPGQPRDTTQKTVPSPPVPPDLPEMVGNRTPTRDLFSSPVPIFFNRQLLGGVRKGAQNNPPIRRPPDWDGNKSG